MVLNAACYFLLSSSAAPKYAPFTEGGKLISGGTDLNQDGVIECVRFAL